MSLYMIGLEIQMAKQVGDWREVERLTARFYRIKEERAGEVSRSNLTAIRARAARLAKLPVDERGEASLPMSEGWTR